MRILLLSLLLSLAACATEPAINDGPVTSPPVGEYSLCKNSPESIWCH
jgi:hypothetical protein